MWLKFGVSKNNTLVDIADVGRGKTTDLHCPYCAGLLIAKKGAVKQHHFAHADESCYPVAKKREYPVLPLYDSFNINLSGKSLQLLKQLWTACGQNNWAIPFYPELKPLIKADLLYKNCYIQPPGYQFTKLGMIPVGALSLDLFNQVQEPMLLKKLAELERYVELGKIIHKLNLHTLSVDLWLYRTQLRNILQQQLYYLQIQADNLTLHKIGVTKRTIEQRTAKVKRDLLSHYKNVEIEVLGLWGSRGNVEKYFKHKYQQWNYPIDTLTEYFLFDTNIGVTVLNDLRQMQTKELTAVELDEKRER